MTWPGVRSERVNLPSEVVTVLAGPPSAMALTLTPSTPTPPRSTRPLISTPGSSLTSTGGSFAPTCFARSDFAA